MTQHRQNLSTQEPRQTTGQLADELYVVHVSEVPQDQLGLLSENFALTFGVSPKKALGLLKRIPGNVTKAIPASEARLISSFFESAGATVMLKPLSEIQQDKDASVQTQTLADSPVDHPSTTSSDTPSGSPKSRDKATDTTTVPKPLSLEDFQKHLEQHSQEDASSAASLSVVLPLQPPRRSVLKQLWTQAILAVVITLLLTLGASAYLMVTGSIQQQANQLQSTAASLAQGFGVLSNLLGQERSAVQTVANAHAIAPPELRFAYALDPSGQPYAGWLADETLDTAALETALGNQTFPANRPVSLDFFQQVLARLRYPPDAVSTLHLNNGQQLWLVSQPLISNTERVGTLVLGLASARPAATLDFIWLLILGLAALMVASLLAYLLSRRFQRRLRHLTEQAHAISLGQLEHEVQLGSQDELQQLAESLERLRISTREALKRLRQR